MNDNINQFPINFPFTETTDIFNIICGKHFVIIYLDEDKASNSVLKDMECVFYLNVWLGIFYIEISVEY